MDLTTEAASGLELLNPDHYSLQLLDTPEEYEQFNEMLVSRYGPLNFLKDDDRTSFLPKPDTKRYGLFQGGELIGICALNPITDRDTVFHQYIRDDDLSTRRIVEVNNVVLSRRFIGMGCLTIMLYEAVKRAISDGFDIAVGITRYQTLRFFIESGAVPVEHPPLHLLGREDILDFIIYYDLSPSGQTFLHHHVPRSIRHEMIFERIKRQYVRPNRKSRALEVQGEL